MMLRGRRAFTLLELILVIAIIALMTGVVAPELVRTLQRWDLAADARTMVGWIRQAQQLAVATQQVHQIKMFQWRYDVESSSGQQLAEVVLKQDVMLHGQPQVLWFDALGAPNRKATLVFLPRDGRPRPQATIEVAPVTGRVQLTIQR